METLEIRDVMSAVPLTIINSSTTNTSGDLAYQDNQIWVAVYAQQQETGAFYYFDAGGNANSVSGLGNVPSYLLSTFTAVAGQAHTYVINMPDTMPGSQFGPIGARMYFGMNAQPDLPVVTGGVQAMSPNNSYFDFIEFTINGKSGAGTPLQNLNIDTTSVDQFGVPISVNVASTELSGGSDTIGIDTTRASVISQFQAFTSDANDPYAICIWPVDGQFGTFRLQNPSDVLSSATSQNTSLEVQTNLGAPLYNGAQYTTVNVYATQAFPADPTVNNPFTIQIDSEQMDVTGAAAGPGGTINWTVVRGVNNTAIAPHVTNVSVLLVEPAISVTQTNLTMANVTGYPNPNTTPFYVQVDAEIMKVIGADAPNQNGTTTWTVVRGQFGSTATTHSNSANVYWNSMRDNAFNATFNSAIDALFNKYLKTGPSSPKLLLTSNADQQTYEGQVVHSDETNQTGPYVLRFHVQGDPTSTPAYDVYYPFFEENRYFWGGYTPTLAVGNAPADVLADSASFSPSAMVFGCEGVFGDSGQRAGINAAQQGVLGDLENQVVAALNRGVALIDNDGANSWKQTGLYYGRGGNTTGQAWNRYAEFLHQDSVSYGALNYGFAYDDNNGQASDIGVGSLSSITSVTATLGAWDNQTVPPAAADPPVTVGISMRGFLASRYVQGPPTPPSTSSEPSASPLALVTSTATSSTSGQAVDAALSSMAGDDAVGVALAFLASQQGDAVDESIFGISARSFTATAHR